ncbi:MAG: SDR family oxidoreductase [Chloroflexota bacterium]|nr:SDR family oxidoreductase [Chloroflexota bacterium]
MKLLILGGTVFVGRHIVRAALARGHEVTLFNRGQHNPDLFPEVEKLRGDRDGDLSALEGRRWDAVIDTSGYVPRVVRASAELLAEKVKHYTFISSISVYDDFSEPGIDETRSVGTLADESVEEVTGETYGPLKALCEQAAEAALPGRVLVIRPGLIVGPYDPTHRFTYWPRRVAAGGEVLAPGNPEQPVQFIDVRDLAQWIVQMVEAKQTGVFNATGPEAPITIGEFLDACRSTLNGAAWFTWVDESFLLEEGVTPFTEMPLWVPEEMAALHTASIDKAVAAGLELRPIEHTIESTFAWDATRPGDTPLRAGLSHERERELLKKYSASVRN